MLCYVILSYAPEDYAGFVRKSREYLLSYRFRALDTDTRIYDFPTSNYFGFSCTRDRGIKE